MRKRILVALFVLCVICFSIAFVGCTTKRASADEETRRIHFAIHVENTETGEIKRDDNFMRYAFVYKTAPDEGIMNGDNIVHKGGKFTFWTHNIYYWKMGDWGRYTSAITRVRLYRNGKIIYENEKHIWDSSDHTIIYSQQLGSGNYILQLQYEVTEIKARERAILEYRFNVDSTPPDLKIRAGKDVVRDGDHINQRATLIANDNNYKATYVMYEGKIIDKIDAFSSMYDFNKVGKYEIYAEDIMGNKSPKITLYYDNEKPTLSVLENGEETDREFVKGSVSFVGKDNVNIKKILYWTESDPEEKEYSGVPIVTKKDKETIYAVAIDLSGNKSQVRKVTIDTEPPKVTISADGVVLDGERTNAKRISIRTTDNQGIAKVEVTRNGEPYLDGYDQITENGIYEVVAYDNAGNKSKRRRIVFDNRKPSLKVKTEKQPTNGTLYTNKKVIFESQDEYDKNPKLYVKNKNGERRELHQRELIQDGKYEVYAEDQCGNRSEAIKVIISTKEPRCDVLIDGQLSEKKYTSSTYIRVEANEGSRIMHNYNGNWIEYASGYKLEDGEHLFKAVDRADNESTIKRIVVDRTAPVIETEDVISQPFRVAFKNETLGKEIDDVKVNGRKYKGEIISPIYGGIYEVEATDKAGNKCTKTIKSEYEGYINPSIKDEVYDTQNMNGETISFSTYEKAKEFASEREMSLVSEKPFSDELLTLYRAFNDDPTPKYGETVYIYKGDKNSSEERIYFSKTALFTILFQNIEDSIQKTMYFEKNSYKSGDNDLHRKDKVFQKDELNISSEYTLFIGGNVVDKVSEEGEQDVEVCDKYGQKKQYRIHILKRVPDVSVKGEFGDIALTKRTYFSRNVEFSLETDSHLLVYDIEHKLLGCYTHTDRPTLSSDGTYYVQGVNRYGKGRVIEVVISRDKSQVEFVSNEVTQKLEVNILSADSVSITQIEVWRQIDGANKRLEVDDVGTVISEQNRKYVFAKSGKYCVYIKDAAHIEKTGGIFEYSKPNPRIKPSSDKKRVSKRFSVEYGGDVVASLVDGTKRSQYVSGTEITKEGKYTICLSNKSGFYQEIEFEIDNTPPEIRGEYAHIGNKDVVLKVFGASEVYVNNERLRHTDINCSQSGKYQIVAVDDVGNKTEVSFEIDKEVNLVGVTNYGLYNKVDMVAKEEMTISLFKDKKQISAAYSLKDPGEYEVVAKDRLGNVKKILFRIVSSKLKSLRHNFGDNKFVLNGVESKGELVLANNGKYEIEYQGNKTEVEIINRTPQLKIEGLLKGTSKANKAILKAEKGAAVEVLYKGKKIQYYEGMVCDKLGKYEVTVTDKYGNQNRTTFEIVKKKPIALVVTLVLVSAGIAVGLGIYFVRRKKKIKNKKEKKK